MSCAMQGGGVAKVQERVKVYKNSQIRNLMDVHSLNACLSHFVLCKKKLNENCVF